MTPILDKYVCSGLNLLDSEIYLHVTYDTVYFKSEVVGYALDIFVDYVCKAVIFFGIFLEEDRVEKIVSHIAGKLVTKT